MKQLNEVKFPDIEIQDESAEVKKIKAVQVNHVKEFLDENNIRVKLSENDESGYDALIIEFMDFNPVVTHATYGDNKCINYLYQLFVDYMTEKNNFQLFYVFTELGYIGFESAGLTNILNAIAFEDTYIKPANPREEQGKISVLKR